MARALSPPPPLSGPAIKRRTCGFPKVYWNDFLVYGLYYTLNFFAAASSKFQNHQLREIRKL